MKKWITLLIIFALRGALHSQGVHQEFLVLNPEGTSDFWIQGTGKDTSAVFRLYEIMSVGFCGADTAGNDSVAAKLTLQLAADTSLSVPGGMWEDHKDMWTSFTADSAIAYKEITNNPMPNTQWGRWIIEGLADNAKDTHVLYNIVQSNYESTRRR